MRNLESDILKILRQNEQRVTVRDIQSKLPKRFMPKTSVPEWVLEFSLDSLRAKGLVTQQGEIWKLRKWEVSGSKSSPTT